MIASKQKKIIGSTDYIDLPELEVDNLRCKIDTGAATSSLHCRDVHLLREGSQEWLCFKLYEPRFQIYSRHEYRFRQFRTRRVRSSNGMTDERYSIKTPVIIMGRQIRTEFTLSFREKMKFPVLLGKRFLRNRFIVDVSLDNINFDLKREI